MGHNQGRRGAHVRPAPPPHNPKNPNPTMTRSYATLLTLALAAALAAKAWGEGLRRPVSPQRPMWLVHVTSLDNEDAAQTADGLPDDLRPYAVLNLAMSNNADPDLLDKYLGQCQAKGVWVMIQPSSGQRHYLDSVNIARYEDYYRRYPNLVGYNFCEQAWGFDGKTFAERCELYCKLLEIADKYGGYLYINDMQSVSNSPWNTIAKMKKYPRFAECARRYSRNLIYGDKLTMSRGYYDNESSCLGMFLGGYADNYAIRFDQFSWSFAGRARLFGQEYGHDIPNALAWFTCPEALAGMSIAEHMMMTGATVVDGPEVSSLLVMRLGRLTPGGKNVVADALRKVLDGTIRIPSRDEVRSRVKVAYVCDSTNNVEDELYAGLYQMDGHKKDNHTYLKRTGRYLSIPTFAETPDGSGFDIVVAQSGSRSYAARWPAEADKVAELDSLYPREYAGTMYVGRSQNRLLAYNNFLNTDSATWASIPLKYNSCDTLSLRFTPHTFAVVEEKGGGIGIYLNNYRTDKDSLWDVYPSVADGDGLPGMGYNDAADYMAETFIDNPTDGQLRRNVISVKGCAGRPSVEWHDRGDHPASTVEERYADGTLTLTVTHNGPLDIAIGCAGGNVGRPQAPAAAPLDGVPQPDMTTPAAQPQLAYDFDGMAEGQALTGATAPWIAADGAGAAQIAACDGSLALNPTAIGSGQNRVGIANLTRFGAEKDYSVTWKECVTQTAKGGVLMRGTYANGGGNPGLMDGYYFQALTDLAEGTTRMAIRKVTNRADGTTAFDNGTQGEVAIAAPEAGRPRWYRATCKGNLLTFEYSDDGREFTRAVARTDGIYPSAGITQLLWGIGVPSVTTSFYDDIRLTYLSGTAASAISDAPAMAAPARGGDTWHTLQGVRVDRPTAPGVYIGKGRKIVVK